MNYPIKTNPRQEIKVSKKTFKCDLYWPQAKLAVEYDSDAFHTGADRIASDAQRRNSLEHLGINVITVTNRQISNFTELDRTAYQIARRLGKRIRPRCADWRGKQIALRDQLFHF